MKNTKVYIAESVRTTGGALGVANVISLGASVITQKELSKKELVSDGLTFYVEFKPLSDAYEIDVMRANCTGIKCIRSAGEEYNTSSCGFSPISVLEELTKKGKSINEGISRFSNWLDTMGNNNTEVIPVVNSLCDAGFIQYLFGIAGKSTREWSGIDLDSLYRGYSRNMSVNLHELGLVNGWSTTCCAGDDAIFLADIARQLIFRRV